MDKIQEEADRLYKKQYGKMIAYLLYYFKEMDFETAEDVVQDAFSAALTAWHEGGVPSSPESWLYKVSKNKALNKMKTGRRFIASPDTNAASDETEFSESVFEDQQLRMLFACAHPDLSPKAQVVITLKYVINLKTEAIAKILAMTIDGVEKLLARAKQKIKEEKLLLQEPPVAALKFRMSIVHKILYLVFNEGYKSSWGKQLVREELCEEALIMTKILSGSNFGNKETAALYALMLFNAARLRSRFSAQGELFDMEEQDRSLWNTDLIALATGYLHQSASGILSSYHYEASIAYMHCIATTFYATDWKTIKGLYLKLLQLQSNPFVELNYAIVLYYAGEKENALTVLKKLQQDPFLNQYYLLNVTLGKIYYLENDPQQAKYFFERALLQMNTEAEKIFVEKMLHKVAGLF